jgi:hypothetical protein
MLESFTAVLEMYRWGKKLTTLFFFPLKRHNSPLSPPPQKNNKIKKRKEIKKVEKIQKQRTKRDNAPVGEMVLWHQAAQKWMKLRDGRGGELRDLLHLWSWETALATLVDVSVQFIVLCCLLNHRVQVVV